MKTHKSYFYALFVLLTLTEKSYSAERPEELRIFFQSQCPITTPEKRQESLGVLGAAILANVAGQVAGGLIDKLGSALSEDKETPFTTIHRIESFYSRPIKANGEEENSGKILDANLKCVVIAISDEFSEENPDFGKDPSDLTSINTQFENAKFDNEKSKKSFSEMKNKTKDLGVLGIRKPPKFYMESVVAIAPGGAAFALEPKFIFYPEFLGGSGIFRKKSRDIMIRFEFSNAGGIDQPFANSQLIFTNIGKGSLSTENLSNAELPWMVPPEGDPQNSPVNVKVLVTETSKPYTIAKYIGNALKAQKDSVTTSVQDAVTLASSKEARQAHRQEMLEAAGTASEKYLAAYDAYIAAQKAVNDATTPAEKSKAENAKEIAKRKLKIALELAKAAYESADIPFVELPTS